MNDPSGETSVIQEQLAPPPGAENIQQVSEKKSSTFPKKNSWVFPALAAALLFIFIAVGGAVFLLSKQTFSEKNSTIPTSFVAQPSISQNNDLNILSDDNKIGLLFTKHKGRLKGHNFDTYTPISNQSYISNLTLNSPRAINIGITTISTELEKTNQFHFQTTRNGKHLIRYNQKQVDKSDAHSIETFTTIFNTPIGVIKHIYISEDSTKVTIEFKEENKTHIAIQDINNPKDTILLTLKRPEDDYIIFGFNTKKNQLYWSRSEGPMTHFTENITFDENGIITETKEITDFDFITVFDHQFQHAYYQEHSKDNGTYVKKIVEKNLDTGNIRPFLQYPAGKTIITNMLLSPTQDKLVFYDTSLSDKYVLHVVTLATGDIKKYNVHSAFNPDSENYISPNGQFVLLQGSFSCKNYACDHTYESREVLFDLTTGEFFLIYEPDGVDESNKGDSNTYYEIEAANFIGWIQTEGENFPENQNLKKIVF